jgi:cytochrome c-type biogenesis protein CcsB
MNADTTQTSPAARFGGLALKLLPWFFVALFATEIIAVFAPKSDKSGFHTREFGSLPVLLNGRIQPFDSVGLNSLRQIRSTGDVPIEFETNKLGQVSELSGMKFWHHAKKLKSTEWLMEVMFKPEAADQHPIFLIHHPDLLAEFKLGGKGVENSGLRYYTFNDLKPLMKEIWDQAGQAYEVNEKQRTPLQTQVIKLQNAVFLYENLKVSVVPPYFDNFGPEYKDFEASIPSGIAAIEAQQAGKEYDTNALDHFWMPISESWHFATNQYAGRYYPMVVPPSDVKEGRDNWGNMGKGILQATREKTKGFVPVRSFAAMATAYHDNNPGDFNKALVEYKSWLQENNFTPELKKGREEFYFNDTKPFLHATIIYIFAFVLAAFSLLTFSSFGQISESLRKSSFYLVMLAGVVHTFGLIFRMYLEGRPPVTNLYSSAIFIGWGAMVLGLILERIYRVGIGVAVASLAGFVTLLIAHNLALGGDTMEMMRAVLDTNFWLATHVVVVTLGYASTFVAGLLGIMYVFLGVFTPLLNKPPTARTAALVGATVGLTGGVKAGVNVARELKRNSDVELGKSLAKMVYGIICFATLFSFVGTVLGGIWADQSWGRFWGWDPKENGALIIVLWNAMILHARWGGMVKERGLMAMAVFGNIVTSFSWFGVNMLGIGLHSYGFMDAAFWWLIGFDILQVVIIAVALIPTRYWTSFSSMPAKPAPPIGSATPA